MINVIKILFSMGVSFILRKPVVWGKPYTLFIEPSGVCNLKCPECALGGGLLSRSSGLMKIEEFRSVIDEVEDHVIILYLYFQGEPFLHKEIYEMIAYARSKKMFVITSTNGHFFSKECDAERLIASGLSEVIISMDGLSQEVYEQYRRGGDIEAVKSGIKNIVKIKLRFGVKMPIVTLQFLIMKHNEHQAEEFVRWGKKAGADRCSLKTVQVYHEAEMENLLPTDDKYRRYEFRGDKWQLKGQFRNFCTKLWVGGVISWDLQYLVCCFDKDGKYSPGNLHNGNFSSLWRSTTLRKFRDNVLHDRSAIDICRNCSEGRKIFHWF